MSIRRFKVAMSPQTVKYDGMETSFDTAEISDALAKFQLEVMQPKKDADNPFYGSKYVPFGNIVRSIMSVAPKYGLSYVQWAVQNEKNQLGVYTRMNHKSGQFMIFGPVFQSPLKPTVQDNGSVQSYLRRYSLQAAFGLGAEEDDDGNGASGIEPGETPAQKAYRENKAKKEQQQKSSYQKGDYKNQKQNQQNTTNSAQNGTNKPSEQPANTTATKSPEMATAAQIEKIQAIVNVIADTQNIHPDDVYPKFQKLYTLEGKPKVPDLDIKKMNKQWAGRIIGVLSKHNEAGQLKEIIKAEPKKEEPKGPTKEQQEQIDNANFDAESHGER